MGATRGVLTALVALLVLMQPSTVDSAAGSDQQGAPQNSTVPLQRAAKSWTTWANNASTAVADALKQATSATNSRPQKLAKGAEGKSAADPPVTTANVQDMVSAGVAAAMQAMSQASHERFQHIEDNIGTLAAQQNQLGENQQLQQSQIADNTTEIQQVKDQLHSYVATEQARMAEAERIRIEATTALQELKQLRDDLTKQRAEALQPPPGLAGRSNASTASGSQCQALPHEQRTEAILSGLGGVTSTQELLQRAQDALKAAQIPSEWHSELTPNNRDTAVFFTFHDAACLRLAANKIRSANISHAPGSRVWLDARRTRAENKPSRAVHRAYEGVSDLIGLCARDGPAAPLAAANLNKDMRKLLITHGADKAAVCWWDSRKAEFVFDKKVTESFRNIGKESDLEQIAAWCSLE